MLMHLIFRLWFLNHKKRHFMHSKHNWWIKVKFQLELRVRRFYENHCNQQASI